jgi:hypothetical protein
MCMRVCTSLFRYICLFVVHICMCVCAHKRHSLISCVTGLGTYHCEEYYLLGYNARFGLPPASTLVSCSAYSAMKMDATCSSETSVDFQRTTRRYIPKVSNLHNHCFENFKSYDISLVYFCTYCTGLVPCTYSIFFQSTVKIWKHSAELKFSQANLLRHNMPVWSRKLEFSDTDQNTGMAGGLSWNYISLDQGRAKQDRPPESNPWELYIRPIVPLWKFTDHINP